MSSRVALAGAGGIAAISGYYLLSGSRQSSNPKSLPQQRREINDSKREAGLSGAGIGQNATTGLHEHGAVGSGLPTGNTHPDRAIKTDAPKEELPSGGVGGGVGAGGANSRAVEITAKKPTTQGGEGGSSKGGQMLQGFFGTGGASAGVQGEDANQKKYYDTKVHSHEGQPPTKKVPGN